MQLTHTKSPADAGAGAADKSGAIRRKKKLTNAVDG